MDILSINNELKIQLTFRIESSNVIICKGKKFNSIILKYFAFYLSQRKIIFKTDHVSQMLKESLNKFPKNAGIFTSTRKDSKSSTF